MIFPQLVKIEVLTKIFDFFLAGRKLKDIEGAMFTDMMFFCRMIY